MSDARETQDQVVRLVGENIGELMEFWGFRRAMGVVWTALYLVNRPLRQEEIAELTQLSAGSVSTTLADLERWGVVHREPVAGDRRRFYVAETDVRAMVTRVLRERELARIQALIAHLDRALRRLREGGRSNRPELVMRTQTMATRLESLLQLARQGERLVEGVVRMGQADLGSLRDLARGSGRRWGV